MKIIDPFIIRTYFGDDSSWDKLREAVQVRNEEFGFEAQVQFINDVNFKETEKSELIDKLSKDYLDDFDFFFIADKQTMNNEDFPLLCVKIPDEYSPENNSFRVISSQVWSVESNLRICNMDFEEFSEIVDGNGIHRGF